MLIFSLNWDFVNMLNMPTFKNNNKKYIQIKDECTLKTKSKKKKHVLGSPILI